MESWHNHWQRTSWQHRFPDRKKVGFLVIRKIVRKTANEVRQAIVDVLGQYKDHVGTITCDNGREFARHREIANDLGVQLNFAYPFESYIHNPLVAVFFLRNETLSHISA